jgi:hypothetical protein
VPSVTRAIVDKGTPKSEQGGRRGSSRFSSHSGELSRVLREGRLRGQTRQDFDVVENHQAGGRSFSRVHAVN